MFFFDHARREETRPASLRPENLRDVQAEIDRYFGLPEEERRQTDVPQIWKRPFADDVLPALMDLSYGKCAFCERSGIPLQPYRFRPPAYATPRTRSNDKESYLWLAFDWNNLYPICEECLPEDKSFFPVKSRSRAQFSGSIFRNLDRQQIASRLTAEEPYLFAPGDDQLPYDEISRRSVDPQSPAGLRLAATIKMFNLDRPKLLNSRKYAIKNTINLLMSGSKSMVVELLYQNDFYTIKANLLTSNVLQYINYFGFCSFVFNFPIDLFNFTENNQTSRYRYIDIRTLKRLTTGQREKIRGFLLQNLPAIATTLFGFGDHAGSFDPTMSSWADLLGSRFDTTISGWHVASWGIQRSQVTSVKVERYKSIGSLSFKIPEKPALPSREPNRIAVDEEVATALLLIGENAAGKSSLLEAIALAAMEPEAFDALVDAELVSADSIHDPRLMGAPYSPAPTTASISLTFDHLEEASVVIDRTKPRPERKLDDGGAPPLVFAYGARRFYAAGARVRAPERIRTLFDPAAALPNPIKWLAALKRRNPRGLDEVVSALRHIISIDGHFRDIDPQPNVDVWIYVERGDAPKSFVPIPLKSASSGYRAVLALVCDIFRGLEEAWQNASDGKSSQIDFRKLRMSEFLVLIDEIEAHLHPRWKMSIIDGLRRAFPRATFIMTSHDPLCLRGMNDGEVLALHRYRSDGRDVVEAISGFEGLQYRTVEQLLTSDLFRLMTTDPSSEREFDDVAELLKRREKGASSLTEEERATLRRFEEEIAWSLPIGNTPVGAVVQEAVAEFLKERRHGDREATGTARDRAKEAVKAFLKEVLG